MRNTRDIRVIRTQTAILKALAELIQKKKLSTITITDLCAKASINRNTFYYHYNNIFEFLDEHKQIVIEDIKKVAEKSKFHSKQVHIDLCHALLNHPYFLSIMLSPNCDIDYFSDIFAAASKVTESFVAKSNNTTVRGKYIDNYCDAGTNAIIKAWILGGMKETPEEIGDIIWETSSKGPFSLMDFN